MKYITNFLDKFIFALACVLTAVLLSMVLVQMLCRNLFNFSFTQVEEYCVLMMAWLTFLAAAYAVRHCGHVAVDFLSENGAPSKICSESGHDYGSFVPYPLHDLLRLWAFHAPDEDAPSYHSHSQRLHVSGGTGVQRYHGPVFSGRAY